jgi:hypothetical protein
MPSPLCRRFVDLIAGGGGLITTGAVCGFSPVGALGTTKLRACSVPLGHHPLRPERHVDLRRSLPARLALPVALSVRCSRRSYRATSAGSASPLIAIAPISPSNPTWTTSTARRLSPFLFGLTVAPVSVSDGLSGPGPVLHMLAFVTPPATACSTTAHTKFELASNIGGFIVFAVGVVY